MNSPKKPIEFRRLGPSGLFIRWSDGETQEIASLTLRRACPCATCRESRGDTSHAKPLTSAKPKSKLSLMIVDSTIEEETRLDRIWPIGQYALGIAWGDGHDSGIFTYQYLYDLEASRNLGNVSA